MIDLRCQIIDGVPCGPASFDESLEVCRAAAADGVKTIVATPRWEAGRAEPPVPFEECRRKLESLAAALRGALRLKLGFALQFSPELPALVDRYGSELALAGKRHLLISLPSVEIPEETEGVWSRLARAGFRVVLAHPECNAALRRDAARLARWTSEGLTLQVDAASVAGAYGREVRRFAFECLHRYESQAMVASNGRRGADRRHSLGKARRELSARVGAHIARRLTSETPASLIEEPSALVAARGRLTRAFSSLGRSIRAARALAGES